MEVFVVRQGPMMSLGLGEVSGIAVHLYEMGRATVLLHRYMWTWACLLA